MARNLDQVLHSLPPQRQEKIGQGQIFIIDNTVTFFFPNTLVHASGA